MAALPHAILSLDSHVLKPLPHLTLLSEPQLVGMALKLQMSSEMIMILIRAMVVTVAETLKVVGHAPPFHSFSLALALLSEATGLSSPKHVMTVMW